MAKPLIPVETMLKEALRLLDEHGVDALKARKLSAELGCSTRTLYEQVGKRDQLIRRLIEYHFASKDFEFERGNLWQESTKNWALTLRHSLLVHPNLARLMTMDHRQPIAHYVTELLRELLKAGFNRELALRTCRVLINVTLNLTLSEIVAPTGPARQKNRSKQEIEFEYLVVTAGDLDPDNFQGTPEVFNSAIDWLIRGIEIELTNS